MLLGNEAANILAEYISGNNASFAELMNKRAAELGCNDTHFVNPSGLHDDNHYSCAHDIAIMYKYAYDNFEDFRKIVSLTSFSLPVSDKYDKDDRTFTNPNKLLNNASIYYYEYCNGGKTGYTKEAKNCLVSSACSGDITLISCVLGGSQDEKSFSQRYGDSAALFDKGFNSMVKTTFLSEGTIVKNIKVENAKEKDAEVSLIAAKGLSVNIDKAASISDFESITVVEDELTAPVFSGDKLGEITYNIYGQIYKIDIVANKTIEEKPPVTAWSILKIVLIVLAILIILIVIMRVINVSNRKKSHSRRLLNVKRYNSRFHK